MSLRLRLVLLVLLSSIPLFALTVYSTQRLRDSDRSNARTRLTALTLLGTAELRSAVDSAQDLLATLAHVPGVAAGDGETCSRVFSGLAGETERFRTVFVTNRYGRVLCHSHPERASFGIADREYFKRARDTGRFVAGEPIIGRATGKPVLATALPLKDAAGEFDGIVFAGLDLRTIGDRIARADADDNTTFAIWAADGTILYRNPDPDLWAGRRPDQAGITRAVQSRDAETVIRDAGSISGEPTLYAISGTEAWSPSRMSVSAGIARSALDERGDAIFWRGMLVSGVVFATALLAALLLGEAGIRRRAVCLAAAAKRMASGDFSARSGLRPSRDELGRLAESFDQMAVALERGTRTLKALSAANHALVHARDESTLLERLCRVVVEEGGYKAAWVGYALHDEARRVEPIAQFGVLPEALADRRLTWADVEGGRGPIGRAIRSGAPVYVRDIDEDAGEGSSRQFARAQGYRAYAAFPIRVQGDVLGVLGIGSSERGRFDADEVALLGQLADDLGYGIQALRNRAALDRHAALLEEVVSVRTAQLEDANRFLDSIIENIPNMIFVKDAQTLRFVRFNRAGEALLGYDRAELIGKGDADFFPPEEASAFMAKDRAVLASGAMLEIAEEPLHTRHGITRYLHTRKIAVVDEAGKPRYLLGISEDITERKEKENQILALNADLAKRAVQLAEANKELESFSYSVSHDLRAPLRHIQGYVELLTATAGDELSDKGRRYLQIVSDAAGEMSQLIDDLLAFSRTARTELHRTAVDMEALVRECIAGLEMQLRGRNVEWRIGPLPPARGDAALLRQVWANLVGNAVKYTRPRDPAVVEVGAVERPGTPVVYWIQDNGVGFDMQHARKLFGVFQRLHRAEDFEGTGIGLATVQRILSRHGGRIWAQASPGSGATFSFTLGAAAAGEPSDEEDR